MTKATEQIAAEDVISIDEARALLNKEAQERVALCQAEINAALARYNCRLDAVPRLAEGRIVADVQLASR